jgi:signal transduction histidine kinase
MPNAEILKDLHSEIEALKKELELKEINYKLQQEELWQAKERAEDSEQMLHTLVETAVGTIGQDFFDNIVFKLSKWLDVDCVIIGQMLEPNRIHCLPLLLDGKISHDFSYELTGAPCDITTRKGYCCYTENVIEQFPKDKILVDLNAKAYIGTALYNKSGEANGVICAVSRKKFVIPPYTEKMLKIIGARVSAEIERKKIEEILKKSETDLRESNATKDKFISVIAHDLKNPFNSILGFSELLLRNINDYSKSEQLNYISRINDTANNTCKLLENLLNWSFAKQGLIKVTLENLNLKELVDEVITLINTQAKAKSISINNKIDNSITVKADKNMFSIVIRNLLTNAIKYSYSDQPINITCMIQENSIAEVCISDYGVGIENNVLNNLFKIDQSFSTPGTNKEIGTGLGLLLCKEFSYKMGGSIWAESTPNKGSKFIFTLNAQN